MGFGLKNTAALTERRRRERQSVAIAAVVHRTDGDPVAIEIDIISPRGFLARTPLVLPEGMLLRVSFPSGRAPHARVVWIKECEFGCEFLTPVDVDALMILPVSARPIGDRGFARKSAVPERRSWRAIRGGDRDQYDLFS